MRIKAQPYEDIVDKMIVHSAVSKHLHFLSCAELLGLLPPDHADVQRDPLVDSHEVSPFLLLLLLSCLPLGKTTSFTTPSWDCVTVLPLVSVIPWIWRQLQE